MSRRSHSFVSPMVLGLVALMGCRDEPSNADPTIPETPAVRPPAIDVASVPELVPSISLAPEDSRAPNVFVTSRGELLLSWLEPAAADDETLRLRVARRTRTYGWLDPVTVIEGELFDNWADVPAVGELVDGTLVAAWPTLVGDGSRYELHWSRSLDDGATWSTPQRLHEHSGGPEYGFVSMALDPDGRLVLHWLDGRRSTPEGGQTQLRSAVIGREGPPMERRVVDDHVCSCCQTATASTRRGPVVAYRDRTDEEIRDIHVAGPRPDHGTTVHDDRWTIAGCPVNGPSLAVVNETQAVAWFTAVGDEPRVWAAFGRVGGAFGPPQRIDLGHPVGRVSLVMPDEQSAIVTFVERRGSEGDAQIVVRRITADARPGPAYRVSYTTAARASGFPRSAISGDRMIWAWTSVDEDDSRVLWGWAPLSVLG